MPIFANQSERRMFKALQSTWQSYEIYPQIPVKNVLGYKRIQESEFLDDDAKDYLFKTEFDFVICKRGSADPILAIELDGLGQGFSRDGNYVTNVISLADPNRRRKLETKLTACDISLFPLIIVSFDEMEPLEAGDSLLVVDAIIGETLAGINAKRQIHARMAEISRIFESDPSGESAQDFVMGIQVENEYQHNPIRKKTLELQSLIPLAGKCMKGLPSENGYRGARFSISGGTRIGQKPEVYQPLVEVEVRIREVNCPFCSTFGVLETIGEYCLIKKALREVGTDKSAWSMLIKEAPWVELA